MKQEVQLTLKEGWKLVCWSLLETHQVYWSYRKFSRNMLYMLRGEFEQTVVLLYVCRIQGCQGICHFHIFHFRPFTYFDILRFPAV